MNSKDIFKIIEKIEANLDLEKFKLYGIDVWPYLRNQLVFQLNTEIKKGNIKKYNYLQRIWEKITLLPTGLFNFLKFYIKDNRNNDTSTTECDILFFTTSLAKRMELEEGWYDVFVDPIIDHYSSKNISYRTFESSQRLDFKYPRYRKTKLILPKMLLVYLRSLFLFLTAKTTLDFEITYNQYTYLLVKNGLKKHIKRKHILMIEFLFVYQLSKYFAIQLKKINPKIVFIVSYYGYTGMALCYACNNLKIKSVDIQHGVQGKYHPAYGSFLKIPLTGFNTMPDIFLNWSKTESDIINMWAKNTNNIRSFVIGNPTQQKFLTNNIISEYYDEMFKQHFINKILKPKVLITLQWGDFIPVTYIKLLEISSDEYFYLIRFHPSTTFKEIKNVKRKLTKINKHIFEIDFPTKLPIYALLRNIDIHITQNSSVVIEAAHFNVKSIVIDKIGAAYYEEYIKNGMAYHYENENQILRMLKQITINKNQREISRLILEIVN
jgi:hypothetical protein